MRLQHYIQPYQGYVNPFATLIYTSMLSIPVYLTSFIMFDKSTEFLEDIGSFGIADEFDFIIVGSGSSGAVVANRLSSRYTVLLLEAGGEPHPLHLIPLFATTILNYPQIDWQHKTVPQNHSTFSQNYRESLLSQGRALGGTSNINFMMHSRGNPRDFDEWAKLLGDPDWSYEKLLPFFKKNENFMKNPSSNYSDFREDVHGHGGEYNIQVPPFTGMAEYYLKATQELGYKQVDINGYYTEGFDYTYTPIKFGKRQSTFTAFLEPIRDRPNLTIRKFAFVKKVLFGNNNEAYGVSYDHHGKPRHAYAKREVVLSAGVNSPKILMLSGIGPKENLEEVGIPVLQDLPVGKNLQDHASTYLGPFFVDDQVSLNADRDVTIFSFKDFVANSRGPFTNPGCSAIGFFASKIAQSAGEADWPDVEIIFGGTSICKECDSFLAHGFNINETVLLKYYEHAKGRDSFMQLVSNARPKARGEMRLRSSDPYEPALIDPKYLDNEHDIKVTIEGVKKAVEIAENTTALRDVGCHFTNVPFPGCENVEFRSDAYWECFIRHFTVSLHHIVGTCAMGRSPASGVVDTKLAVFGTKRLRVIDASVMPLVPVGNTNAPTVMIGEKGADLILKLWDKEDMDSHRIQDNLVYNRAGLS